MKATARVCGVGISGVRGLLIVFQLQAQRVDLMSIVKAPCHVDCVDSF